MATIPTSEILAELAKHPYKQTDKVQIGGSDHYVKVFVLGTQTPKIIEDSGNPSSIAQACDDILCVGKKGIVVDGTTCYVLKETTPCGTFKRAVVFESSTNAQIVGVVDNDSVTLSTQQGGGIKVASTLPNGGDFVGQICVLTTGSTYVWTGSEWSSTAGSSTLPTATSANNGSALFSNGSAWEESPAVVCRKKTEGVAWPSQAICIGRLRNTSNPFWLQMKIRLGVHGNITGRFHITMLGTGHAVTKIAVDNHVSPAIGSTFTWFNPSLLKFYKDSTGEFYYIGINTQIGQGGFTFESYSNDNGDTYPISDTNIGVKVSTSTLTEITSGIVYNTSVPVSTASNQMLVSDGNGGWKVLEAGTTGQVLKMTSSGIAWASAT